MHEVDDLGRGLLIVSLAGTSFAPLFAMMAMLDLYLMDNIRVTWVILK